MIIQTNTWHYQLYAWTFNYKPAALDRTNLCAYVRRIMLVTPLLLLLGLVSIPIFLLSYITYAPGALLFGLIFKEKKPLQEASPQALVHRYTTWVTSREAPQFMAGFFCLGVMLVFTIFGLLISKQHWPPVLALMALPLFTPVLFGAILLLVITIQGIGLGFRWMWERLVESLPEQPERQGEPLFVAYFRAKKKRVCPIVTFE